MPDRPQECPSGGICTSRLHEIEDAYFNGRKQAVEEADHKIRKLFASSAGRENRDSYNDGVRDALWSLAGILGADQ